MDNTTVLKTAVGVGILGTVAVYLGYSYFNEDIDNIDAPTEVEQVFEATDESSVTAEVAEAIAEKKTALQSFFASAYNTLNSTEDVGEKLNEEIISN